jgi:hypothetical protein
MNQTIRISTIRGAGLSFPIAALFFVITGRFEVFGLVIAGAIVGWMVGEAFSRDPAILQKRSASLLQTRAWIVKFSWVPRILFHQNLLVRFASLSGLGVFLHLLGWIAGYYLLPEGFLRSSANAMMTQRGLDSTSTSAFEEWLKIARANILPALFIVAGSLLIRINRLTFGYIVALYNVTLYGIFIGTNSFAIPYTERLAPSFSILQRSGPYEMAGLILLAAATCSWSFFEIKHFFRSNPEPVSPRSPIKLEDVIGVAVGICLLLAANWIEASMIITS